MLHSPIPIMQPRQQNRHSRNYSMKWRSGCSSGGGSSASSMTPTSAASSMYSNWLGDDTYSLHFLIHYAIPQRLATADLKMFFVCEELYEHEMKQIGDWWSLKISVSRSLDIKSLHYTYELRDITFDDTDFHNGGSYNYQCGNHYHHHSHHYSNGIAHGTSSGGSSGSDYYGYRTHYDNMPSMLSHGSNINTDDECNDKSAFGANSKIKGDFSVSSLETSTSELITRIKEQARPRSNVVDCEFRAGGCRSSARELYLEELPHDSTVIEVRDRWIDGDNSEDSYLRTDFFSTLFSTPHSASPGFDLSSVPVSSSTAIPDDSEDHHHRIRSQNSVLDGMLKKNGMEFRHGKITFVNTSDDDNPSSVNATSPTNESAITDNIATNNNNDNDKESNNGNNEDDYNDSIGGGIPCAIGGTEIVYDDDDDDVDIEFDDNDDEDDEDDDDESGVNINGNNNIITSENVSLTNSNATENVDRAGINNNGSGETAGVEGRSSSIPVARAFRRRRFLVTFKVLCTCLDKEEEEVRVAGGLLSLGCWNAEDALPMTCDEYPVWTATLDLSSACFDDVSPDDKNFSFEYKYLIAPKHKVRRCNTAEGSFSPADSSSSPAMTPQIIDSAISVASPTGRVLWETCPNRRFASVVDGMWNATGGGDSPRDVAITLNDSPFEQEPWRGVGLSVNLASLRSERNLGLGEFPDIKQLVDWAAPAGFSYIQITPINDLADTQDPLCANPNAPISVFAFNPVFLRLDDVSGTPEANIEIERLKARCKRAQALMSYKEIINAKMLILILIYESRAPFVRSDPEYSAFLETNRAWLEPYARYKIKHWTPLRRHTASATSSATSPTSASGSGASSVTSSASSAVSNPSSSLATNVVVVGGSNNNNSINNSGSSTGGPNVGGQGIGSSGGSGSGGGSNSGIIDGGATAAVGGSGGGIRATTVSAPPEEFFFMVQWFLHIQLLEASQYASKKKIALHIEMPFFVHPDGVDYHENPSLFYPTSGPDGIYASRLPSEAGTALTGGSYSFITPHSLLPTSSTTSAPSSTGAPSAGAPVTTATAGGSAMVPSSPTSPQQQTSSQSMQPVTKTSSVTPMQSVQAGVGSTGIAQVPSSSSGVATPSSTATTTVSATVTTSGTKVAGATTAAATVAAPSAIMSLRNAGTPSNDPARQPLLAMLASNSAIRYPVPRWEAHQDQEYQWYGMRLEHLSQYFQGVCFKDVLNYFRIWTVPAYTDDPMYGAFVPHVPVESFEVELAGIKHVDNYCRPFFTRQAAATLFGADANKALDIIADCVGEGSGYYTLKPELMRPDSPAEKSLPQSYVRALKKLRRYYTLFRREEEAPRKKKRSKEGAKRGKGDTPGSFDSASGNDSDNSFGSIGSADTEDSGSYFERNGGSSTFGLFGNRYFAASSATMAAAGGNNGAVTATSTSSGGSSRGLIPLPIFTEPWCPVLDDLDRNERETLQSIHREYYFGSRSTVLWENTGRTVLEQIASSTQMLVTAEAADLRLVPEWCRLGLAASGIALHAPLWVHETAVRNTPVLSVASSSSLSFAPLVEWWKECRNERFKRSIYADRLWLDGGIPSQCSDEVIRRAVEKTLDSNSLLALLPLQDVLALKSEFAEIQRSAPDLIAQEDFRYRTPVTIEELVDNGSFVCFLRALFEQAGRSCSYKNGGKCFPVRDNPKLGSNGINNSNNGSGGGNQQQNTVLIAPKNPSTPTIVSTASQTKIGSPSAMNFTHSLTPTVNNY